MYRSPSFARAPLAAMLLFALTFAFASSGSTAPRLRLRCTVTPRNLPAAGGQVTIRVDAGTQPVDAILATIVRPDRTSLTQELKIGDSGKFETSVQIEPNFRRTPAIYFVKIFGLGENPNGTALNCGTIRVQGFEEAPRFFVKDCKITPRSLPATGGQVQVDARISGPRRGLQVRVVAFGAAGQPEANLIGTATGLYRGSLTLPANANADPLSFNLHVIAEAGDDITGMDCGIVTVASATLTLVTPGIVVSASPGGFPGFNLFRSDNLAPIGSLLPYGRDFQGSANVALGDFNADGVVDFAAAPGPGAAPHVKVFDGKTGQELRSFFAFDPSFTGGVTVAAGDVNGDGAVDLLAGAGQGATGGHIKVFSGRDGALLSSFLAYGAGYIGGVRVAAGDVNGDGRADIITGTSPGFAAHVKAFSGLDGSTLRSFFAFTPSFTGGVNVAAGDINGDGKADIIVGAGAGATPHVKVFSGGNNAELRSFFAFDSSFTGGVSVGAGDVNGDGKLDLITGAGAGAAGGHVKVFDGIGGAEIRSFFSLDAGFTGGVVGVAGDTRIAVPIQ